jgi:hypothetical protein
LILHAYEPRLSDSVRLAEGVTCRRVARSNPSYELTAYRNLYAAFMASPDFPSGIPMASSASVAQRRADRGPTKYPSCGGAVMEKNIQGEKDGSPYSVLPCVLLLLAAGLFAKISVAAQLVHHLH